MDDLRPLTLTRDESEIQKRSEGHGPAIAIGVPLRGRSRFGHVMAFA